MNTAIRFYQTVDMRGILDIERDSFENPWGTNEVQKIYTASRHSIQVAKNLSDKVVGYIVYHINKRDGIDILRIGVHKDYRRQGIGRQLIDVIKGKLHDDRTYISVKVNELDLKVQLFFRKNGFEATEILTKEENEITIVEYQMEYLFIPETIKTL